MNRYHLFQEGQHYETLGQWKLALTYYRAAGAPKSARKMNQRRIEDELIAQGVAAITDQENDDE